MASPTSGRDACRRLSPAAAPRRSPRALPQIYLVGGADATGAPVASVTAFDPISETYNTALQPMTAPRYRAGVVAVGGVIYVVAGMSVVETPTSALVAYTVATNSWAPLADSGLARSDVAAAAIGTKIYVVGGYPAAADGSANYNTQLSTLQIYDTVANSWTTAPNGMPSPRGDVAGVAAGGRFWTLGGWSCANNCNDWTASAAVEVYDPASGTWTVAANMLAGRGDAAVVPYRGRVYVFGGEAACPQLSAFSCPVHAVESFQPDATPASGGSPVAGANGLVSAAGSSGGKGVWVAHAPLPGARFRYAVASAEAAAEAVFVFGGQKRNSTTTDSTVVLDTVSAFYDTFHAPVYAHTSA